jgi:hypothetical protein
MSYGRVGRQSAGIALRKAIDQAFGEGVEGE